MEVFESCHKVPMPESSDTADLREQNQRTDLHHRLSATERELQPFFVVVQDSLTGEYLHPHVHYLFSDDDPDILTSAINGTDTVNLNGTKVNSNDELSSNDNSSNPRRGDRVIVVDMNEDPSTVRRAKSLSGDWQVIDTNVSNAPSFENRWELADNKLMLTIHGQGHSSNTILGSMKSADRSAPESEKDARKDLNFSRIDALASQYEQELQKLRLVAALHQGSTSE